MADTTPTPDPEKALNLLQALADTLQALETAGEEPSMEYDHVSCESGEVRYQGRREWSAKLYPRKAPAGLAGNNEENA